MDNIENEMGEQGVTRSVERWDSNFMQIAIQASKNCTFKNAIKEGAVIVNKRIVLGIGWNGIATKLPDKDFANINITPLSAIQNAFIFASVGRFDLEGATIFCTHYPDWYAANVLIQYGVSHIVYLNKVETCECKNVSNVLQNVYWR